MSEAEFRFPIRQEDGSYRLPVGHPYSTNPDTVWGTQHYWARRHNLLDRRGERKNLLMEAFPLYLSVDEGCSHRIYPEEIVAAVADELRREMAAANPSDETTTGK